MTPLGSVPSPVTGATAAAGSLSTGAPERAAKLDAARHALAAGRGELSSHPLDRDANASADRDADGWTGGPAGDDARHDPAKPAVGEPSVPERPRLPEDPCGSSLDVTI